MIASSRSKSVLLPEDPSSPAGVRPPSLLVQQKEIREWTQPFFLFFFNFQPVYLANLSHGCAGLRELVWSQRCVKRMLLTPVAKSKGDTGEMPSPWGHSVTQQTCTAYGVCVHTPSPRMETQGRSLPRDFLGWHFWASRQGLGTL